jgi:hypothetical protein
LFFQPYWVFVYIVDELKRLVSETTTPVGAVVFLKRKAAYLSSTFLQGPKARQRGGVHWQPRDSPAWFSRQPTPRGDGFDFFTLENASVGLVER